MTEIDERASWRTASYSMDNNNCVEVGRFPACTGIRDTKDRGRGHLEIGPTAWCELLSTLKR
ncbi:DUF397 domain-containing protein [Embleya sp. AB8]|uniref:DUF397 domain-containing protein n=1 Tax=Embleya sp. AB8 TaxID=3156304 RepID=UPI003C71C472